MRSIITIGLLTTTLLTSSPFASEAAEPFDVDSSSPTAGGRYSMGPGRESMGTAHFQFYQGRPSFMPEGDAVAEEDEEAQGWSERFLELHQVITEERTQFLGTAVDCLNELGVKVSDLSVEEGAEAAVYLTTLHRVLKEKMNQLKALTENVTQLQEGLTNVGVEKQALSEELALAASTAAEAATSAASEKTVLEERLAATQTALDTLTSDYAAATGELAALNVRIGELETVGASATSALAGSVQSYEAAQTELKDSKASVAALEAKVEKLKAKIESQDGELQRWAKMAITQSKRNTAILRGESR